MVTFAINLEVMSKVGAQQNEFYEKAKRAGTTPGMKRINQEISGLFND